jgi:N-methylhydantoinase B
MRRGGFALVRELEVLTDVVMTIHGDREKFTPWGIGGGLNGGGCSLIINKGTDKEFNAGMYATGVHLKAGDRIYYTSSGGGGFGNPLEREPQLVLDDVMDEWLTIGEAKAYYGVVVEEIDAEACEYRINEEETKKAREQMKAKGFEEGFAAHQIHPFGKDIKPDWIPTEEEVKPHITISRPPGW